MHVLLIGHPSARQAQLGKLKSIGILKDKKVNFFELDEKPALYQVKELITEKGVNFVFNIETLQLGTCHLATEIKKVSKEVIIYGIGLKPCPSKTSPKGQDLITTITCATKFLPNWRAVVVEKK